jgi:hypothetical protein
MAELSLHGPILFVSRAGSLDGVIQEMHNIVRLSYSSLGPMYYVDHVQSVRGIGMQTDV